MNSHQGLATGGMSDHSGLPDKGVCVCARTARWTGNSGSRPSHRDLLFPSSDLGILEY